MHKIVLADGHELQMVSGIHYVADHHGNIERAFDCAAMPELIDDVRELHKALLVMIQEFDDVQTGISVSKERVAYARKVAATRIPVRR